MIKYHIIHNGICIAEIIPESGLVKNYEEILDFMVEAGYHGCNKLMICKENLHPDFFDLKTGIAGELLQKFSNYRMKLAIIGDFSKVRSKSLRDFIRESNNRGLISFVDTLEEALA